MEALNFGVKLSFTPKPKWGKTPTLGQNAHTKNYMGVLPQSSWAFCPISLIFINVKPYIINLVQDITIN